jgi:hypothetical protein
VVMQVTGTNVYGKKALNKAQRFDVGDATSEIGDQNRDGVADLNDVAAGHIVSVTAKVRKKGKLPRTIKGQKFMDLNSLVTLPEPPPITPVGR